jgi:predicted transcriptional regulator
MATNRVQIWARVKPRLKTKIENIADILDVTPSDYIREAIEKQVRKDQKALEAEGHDIERGSNEL